MIGKASPTNYDISGWATVADVECTDGRVIDPNAFIHNSGTNVPFVWQHNRSNVRNVLGNAHLEGRPKGVYAYAKFNDTESGRHAKTSVEHGDVESLSIYANNLVQRASRVLHGNIRELSLVMTGANPGAKIDNLSLAHDDGANESEAIIYSGKIFEFSKEAADVEHEDESQENGLDDIEHEDVQKVTDDTTLGDIYDSMTKEQQDAVHIWVAAVMNDDEVQHSNEEGEINMKKNVFDSQNNVTEPRGFTPSEWTAIVENAKRNNGSLAHSIVAFVEASQESDELEHSITDIGFLFPDATALAKQPALYTRKMEWVEKVFGMAHKSPFSRIKTIVADMTADQARAKGYTTGNQKVEQVLALLKRTTSPTTVYKKQGIDRDDMLDITDINVVVFLKSDMRVMLEEELARAILVGDGRSGADNDKVDETCIRPIYTDDALYSYEIRNPVDSTTADIIDSVVTGRKDYHGSGSPTFFGTPTIIASMLLSKDTTGRRLYKNKQDLAAALLVKEVVEVPVMENLVEDIDGATGAQLEGIVVNMMDYNVGADKGGAVTMFDDFDIDYNKHKYLIETRASGALTRPKSAMVITKIINTP